MAEILEKEVYELGFEGKEFYKGIEKSLKSINLFNKSIQLKDSDKGLKNIDRASRSIKLDHIAKSADVVARRMSNLGVIGDTVLSNLTNNALRLGTTLADNIVTKPLRDGFTEYETMMDSVQTILANTARKGTTLDNVVDALDELNTYADQTIYNFSQMTSNIGTFTAAGVGLETSVSAIKGIANLAAISGSNAHQASTAMYQLSQAISTGVLTLQDWNSVTNAGMGGEIFQEELKSTARIYGVEIDKIIESNGSFRNSLQEGWLSTEILLSTLEKFTGDLTQEQLENIGYTEDQIKSIQALGITANDAATKVKTLTQLKDTLKEEMQSGWSQSWRIIFGEFDEAKESFGEVGNVLGELVSDSASARNNLLGKWKTIGGRETLVSGVINLLQSGVDMVFIFKEAFADIFPPMTAGRLLYITREFQKFTERLKMGEERTKKLATFFRGLAAGLDILFMLIKAIIFPLINYFKTINEGSKSLLDLSSNLGEYLINLRKSIIDNKTFEKSISKITQSFQNYIKKGENLLKTFRSFTIVRKISNWFKSLSKDKIYKFFEGISKVVLNLKNNFIKLLSRFEKLKKEFSNLKSFQRFQSWIKSLDGSNLKGLSNILKTEFKNFRSVFKQIQSLFSSIPKPDYKKIFKGIDDFIISLSDYISDSDISIDWSKLLKIVKVGLSIGLIRQISKILQGGWLSKILGNFFGKDSTLIQSATEAFGSIQSVFEGFQNNLKADTLLKIAYAIAIVTASVFAMSLLDSEKLAKATVAMGALMLQLVGAVGVIAKLPLASVAKSTIVIMGLSTSVAILALSVKTFSKMDNGSLVKGLLSVSLAIAQLIIAAKIMGSSSTSTIKAAVSMGVLSFALMSLSKSVSLFGNMDLEVLSKGLVSIGSALLGFAIFSRLVDGKKLISSSIGLGVMGGSIMIFAEAVSKMGNMSWETLIRGMVGVAGAITILAIGLRAMNGTIMGATSLVVASGALLVLSNSMLIMSSLGWEGIAISLVGFAGALTILGVAGLVLAPVIPVLMGLGAGMLLIGTSVLAVGTGIVLFSTGLVALAGVSTLVAGSISALGLALIALIPQLSIAIANGIINFIVTIANAAPKLFESGRLLILTLVKSVTSTIPEIVLAVVLLLLALIDTITTHLPQFTTKGLEMLSAFLKGISDNIEDVVTAAMDIVTNFIQGMSDSTPDLVDASFEFVLSWINALSDGIEEYTPDLITAVSGLGQNMVGGLTTAIVSGITGVVEAAKQLAQAALSAVAETLGIHSDSREMIKMGGYTISGFLNPINKSKEKVKKTFKELANSALESMERTLSSDISNLTFSPVVTPILNPNNMRKGFEDFDDYLGVYGKANVISNRLSDRHKNNQSEKGVNSNITYIQNIRSPEPLTSRKIYKQTNSLLAKSKKA